MASLHDVSQNVQDCVYGYIRQCQLLLPTDNPYYNIPELVIQLIIFFYYFGDEFDKEKCNANFQVSDDKRTITKKDFYDGSAYLTNIVSSGRHKWKFKFIKVTDGLSLTISCWKAKYDIDVSTHTRPGRVPDSSYSWVTTHGDVYPGMRFGERHIFKDGDIVEMILDLQGMYIRFEVNEEDLGVAFNQIEKTDYRVGFDICNKGDTVELVSYSQIG